MSARTRAALLFPVAPPWFVDRWLNLGDAPVPTLERLRGRVVVLHAFQMLCPGCVLHGLPQAKAIDAAFDRRDVQVLGVHTVFEHHAVTGPDALAAFVHEYRLTFPIGIDAPSERGPIPQTMQAYGLRGTPSLVLIDRQGRLRATHFGRVDDLSLGAALGGLIAEATPSPEAVEPDCAAEGCALPAPPARP